MFPSSPGMNTGLGCTLLWDEHWSGMYSGLGCTLVWDVHWSVMYTGLGCTLLWNVHWSGMYTGLGCTLLWQCILVWDVHCSGMYTGLRCMGWDAHIGQSDPNPSSQRKHTDIYFIQTAVLPLQYSQPYTDYQVSNTNKHNFWIRSGMAMLFGKVSIYGRLYKLFGLTSLRAGGWWLIYRGAPTIYHLHQSITECVWIMWHLLITSGHIHIFIALHDYLFNTAVWRQFDLSGPLSGPLFQPDLSGLLRPLGMLYICRFYRFLMSFPFPSQRSCDIVFRSNLSGQLHFGVWVDGRVLHVRTTGDGIVWS